MAHWPKSLADKQQVPHRVVGKESMNVSADDREEFEETIADHMSHGWKEISRRADRDGTFHAKLTR